MKDTTMIGQWLTTTRERQGYSKLGLAKASGVDRAHIFKIERGDIPEPKEDTRQRLHDVFGTSDDDLVEMGILKRRTYERASGTVTEYEYAPRPLIPPAQQPVPASGDDAMLNEVLRIWPLLPEPERRHLVRAAQMAEMAVRQEQTLDASGSEDRPESETRLGRQTTP